MPIPEAGGRARRGRRVSTSLSEINVIPLVDVMLVLLIIFMVAAPMMQKGIEVNLPQAQRSTQKMTEERMYITVPLSYRKDGQVYLDDEPVPLAVVPERMRQMLVSRDEREVFLRGDGGVQLQELMDVIDSLKSGGVERVGIVTQPVTKKR